MNDELVKYQLDKHETRLNSHSERLDKIENKQAETNVKLDNLCNSINGLTSIMKRFLAFCVTTLTGFFIWCVQANLFK